MYNAVLNYASQMFNEDGGSVETFIRPGGHTGSVSVCNAEYQQTVYKKTPQGTDSL